MKVTIYTKSGDPYSEMIKNLLNYYNIEHETIEVSRNPERLEKLKQISGQYNTPVLEVDDKIYIGFDREKIKEILDIKN